jgi:hypothetical protein
MVVKLLTKYKEIGSVAGKLCSHSRYPSTSEEVCETVMAKFSTSPEKSLRHTSLEIGIPEVPHMTFYRWKTFNHMNCSQQMMIPTDD